LDVLEQFHVSRTFSSLIASSLLPCFPYTLLPSRYIAGDVCGLPNPLANLNPTTALGTFVELTVAWWELALGGLVVGWIAAFDYVTMWVERFERQVRVLHVRVQQLLGQGSEGGQESGQEGRDATKSKHLRASVWAAPLLFGGVVVPVGCSLVACALGALLAHTCGWSFRTGFQYVTSVLAGMGTPLTNASPATINGDVVTLMVALLALSIEGTLLAMLASMTAVAVITKYFNGLAELSKVR
jgi:hypothetical protein